MDGLFNFKRLWSVLGKLHLKVMHYNIALHHKIVTNCVTFYRKQCICYFCITF